MPDSVAKTRRPPTIIVVWWLMSTIFIGILVFAYVVTKRANPIYLDEHGRPVNQSSSAGSSTHH